MTSKLGSWEYSHIFDVWYRVWEIYIKITTHYTDTTRCWESGHHVSWVAITSREWPWRLKSGYDDSRVTMTSREWPWCLESGHDVSREWPSRLKRVAITSRESGHQVSREWASGLENLAIITSRESGHHVLREWPGLERVAIMSRESGHHVSRKWPSRLERVATTRALSLAARGSKELLGMVGRERAGIGV